MPSKSPEQARLMRAVAHGWKKPGGGGPTQAVAKKFVNADRRNKVQGYQFGGMTGPSMYRRPQMGPLSRDPRAMPPQGGGQQPWRGAPPPRVQPGRGMPPGGPRGRGLPPGRHAGPGGPRGGALGQVGTMRGQGRPQLPGGKGPRISPPPNKYPGGGNPMLGGRNPMMRQTSRYNPAFNARRGPTSFLR